MSSPLYLIRHSVHTISPGLYSSHDLNVSACTLKISIDSHFSKQQAMTYGQLLDVIMHASKVIIL